MHTLGALKAFFESKKIKIKEFSGWYLIVKNDRWSMFDGEYYVNGVLIDRKNISKFY
jgi:hypothetical protein